MKFCLFLLIIFYSFGPANAQENSSCKQTLNISEENILKIFNALQDRSIRSSPQSDKKNSTICLEGQKDANVYSIGESFEEVRFNLFDNGKEKEATKLYNTFKKMLQNSKPDGWFEQFLSSKLDYNKNFLLKDKERKWAREISLGLFEAESKKFTVYILFSSNNERLGLSKIQSDHPGCKLIFDVFNGIEDDLFNMDINDSIRWTPSARIEGQLIASGTVGGYHKEKGSVNVGYQIMTGGTTDETLKLFSEWKQRLTMCKPANWWASDIERLFTLYGPTYSV
ncbi:MAG: hypothetical protein ACRDEB_06530 [Chitinophagaceae bacterium]